MLRSGLLKGSAMSKVIAVFGAGSGLGRAVACRFGREGYRVALVARRADRLDALVRELEVEGIESAPFPADLADPAVVPGLIGSIRAHFGRIDVAEYSPISLDQSFIRAVDLRASDLQTLTPLLLLTPVEIVHALLPEWQERGEGAFLLAQGFSAAQPMPNLSGLGTVMASTRNYVHGLYAELADSGVYAGMLTIASLIDGSEVSAAAAAAFEEHGAPEFPVASPEDLADIYWQMVSDRNRAERFHPENPAG